MKLTEKTQESYADFSAARGKCKAELLEAVKKAVTDNFHGLYSRAKVRDDYGYPNCVRSAASADGVIEEIDDDGSCWSEYGERVRLEDLSCDDLRRILEVFDEIAALAAEQPTPKDRRCKAELLEAVKRAVADNFHGLYSRAKAFEDYGYSKRIDLGAAEGGFIEEIDDDGHYWPHSDDRMQFLECLSCYALRRALEVFGEIAALAAKRPTPEAKRSTYLERLFALCDECVADCVSLMAENGVREAATRDGKGEPIGDTLFRTSYDAASDAVTSKEIVALRQDGDDLWYATDLDEYERPVWKSDWDAEYYCDVLEAYDWLAAAFGPSSKGRKGQALD